MVSNNMKKVFIDSRLKELTNEEKEKENKEENRSENK